MNAPESEVLKVELLPIDDEHDIGFIACLTIDRPDKLNALNAEVMDGLKAVCAWVEARDDVRVLIVTGAPPNPPAEGKRAKPHAFVAGADITEFAGAGSEVIRVKFTDNAVEALWNLSKPTIAMVDGFALGGGCEVACSCDIRIATDRSRFGAPEINLGLIPGYGATQRLERLVGYGKAHEMIMTGDMVPAEEAHRIGLVNHVVAPEELKDTVYSMARRIGTKSSHALRVGKEVVRSALDESLTEGVATEAAAFAGLFDSEDKEIGVQAFINRETAQWKHK
ncbi:enoyl-CoA hydratase-related protein [Candidatus Poseidonia alphae]|nr:enoyl-CoA hydratase-related protein [Candidatus Poseidonia alphae]MDB2335996.1 enoyl-CoA hydratase-related protein [Candidatus Poseidonia alphae]MDB2568801.1 enoyl-CoA hydratase-related protein [Candidatus Poseidonia alphae]MDC0625917.1 enoyl-CoA hydratase-related protein [Candidatus Poseidonia alphae]